MTALRSVNQCRTCKGGVLFFVRFWLGREIRECDMCHARFNCNTEETQ